MESHDGYPLGTLCVLDYQLRELIERQRFALQDLANQVMAHMELMQAHREQAELICELKTIRHELTQRADTDPLTGLFNRCAFEQRFNQAMAQIHRGAPPAALMLIDLDHFKTVNDIHGHRAGDEVILRFTDLCRKTFRQADVIGRWGGEEFVVLLPGATVVKAQRAANRLHQLLATTPMLEDISPQLHITASIGVCSLNGFSNLNDCLHRADELLYRAKQQGRNRTTCEKEKGRE